MPLIILLIVALVAYFLAPKWLKVVLCVLNIFIPDPIPFIDEVIMIAIAAKED